MKSFKEDNKGFSLVEVMVAIAVLVIVASSVLSGFVQASRINLNSQYLQDAGNLAQVTSEIFKSSTINDIKNKYSLTGYETHINEDSNGVITITNLKEEYIYNGRLYDEPFDVEVKLNPTKYQSSSGNFTTTYNQQSQLLGSQGADTSVAVNSFLIPEIKEIGEACIISPQQYNDSKALDEYRIYLTEKYTEYRVNAALAAGGSTAGIAAACETYINNNFSSIIPAGDNKYISSDAAGKFVSTPVRTMTIKVTCCPTVGGTLDESTIKVLISGKYEFPALKPASLLDNISIPAKTISIDNIYETEFIVDNTNAALRRNIYLYFCPVDINGGYMLEDGTIGGGDAVKDKIIVNYANGGGRDIQGIISLYLVAQRVSVGSSSRLPLFNSSSLTINNLYADNFNVYSNFQVKTGTNVSAWSTAGAGGYKGYVTDGGLTEKSVYDMEIWVRLNGREYAYVKTTKEE